MKDKRSWKFASILKIYIYQKYPKTQLLRHRGVPWTLTGAHIVQLNLIDWKTRNVHRVNSPSHTSRKLMKISNSSIRSRQPHKGSQKYSLSTNKRTLKTQRHYLKKLLNMPEKVYKYHQTIHNEMETSQCSGRVEHKQLYRWLADVWYLTPCRTRTSH